MIKEYDLRIKEYEHLNTREKISEKNYWKKFYLNFCTYLFHEKNCHDNYVGANLKLLRSFFNYLADENNPHPGFYFKRFYVPSEEVPVIVLVPERLNFLIHNKEFEASLPKHLRRIKDMFVFGCTTALRFSDLVALVPANIEKINANTYVCVRSKKTNTFSRVYLPDYATCILAKYRRRKKSLFPPISLTNFNVGLKKIALLAGWTEDMQKIRSKQGIPKEYFKDATHNQ
ncbi:MAG: hypothetical protein ACXVOH_14445, partial [Bacteroidia bacterium]